MEEGPLGWGRRQEEVVDGWRKGPWTGQEDKLLVEHVRQHGEGRWNSVSKLAGTVSVICMCAGLEIKCLLALNNCIF